jgi:hypothetical protein
MLTKRPCLTKKEEKGRQVIFKPGILNREILPNENTFSFYQT